ncbi:hypothetical protein [Hyphobacterium sp.]|jgi:hypothetical protein|uniref:hypothetical protein n=1 Tax=Hyphobacterium sp. TaxID=2004662 RepID=UPI003BABBF32
MTSQSAHRRVSPVARVWLAGLILAACSTAPRPYSPVLAPDGLQPTSPEFIAALETCLAELPEGTAALHESRIASAGVGTAAGYATGVVLVVSTLDAGLATTVAVADTAVIAMPMAGLLAAGYYSHRVRARRERAIQSQLSACLARNGYAVESWQRVA